MLLQKNMIKKSLGVLLFSTLFGAAHAEIVIHGTRVIYPSDAREVTVQLSNDAKQPVLVQSWMDQGDASQSPEQANVPFVISPPITRVEAERGQALRITALPTTQQLPQNQESLFWLNVLDIPPNPTVNGKQAENFMQLAIRSRIKFFYRPIQIKGSIVEAAEQMKWRVQGQKLVIDNSTPFHMTITEVQQRVSGQAVNIVEDGIMIAPNSQHTLSLKSSDTSQMKFSILNDYGTRVTRDIKF